ncbi:MAG: 3-hydroxyacyl-CoA dehydrogenase family protein [Bacteroidota bacterium]
MKIGILASPAKQNAWMHKQSPSMPVSWVQDSTAHENFDVFIDLDFDNHTERITTYQQNIKTLFLLGAVKCNLEGAFYKHGHRLESALNNGMQCIGINNLRTFIERNLLEFSNPMNIPSQTVATVATHLGYIETECVNSRVGMITPRVVCMIINEAFYTVQEGTATESDIDQAMKLGTNYPMGPFEWCEKIGLSDVYETLEAMYQDTHDERYKICSLLKQRYLK